MRLQRRALRLQLPVDVDLDARVLPLGHVVAVEDPVEAGLSLARRRGADVAAGIDKRLHVVAFVDLRVLLLVAVADAASQKGVVAASFVFEGGGIQPRLRLMTRTVALERFRGRTFVNED